MSSESQNVINKLKSFVEPKNQVLDVLRKHDSFNIDEGKSDEIFSENLNIVLKNPKIMLNNKEIQTDFK